MAVVLELLRGEDLESLSRKSALTDATLTEWRESFLADGEAGSKIRDEDLVDEQGGQMNSVVAELTMTVELQNLRIHQPAGRFSLADISKQTPSASTQLVKKAIEGLQREGRIELTGSGRGAYWTRAE